MAWLRRWFVLTTRRAPVQGMLPIPATDLVSPIFTMWLTLLLMYTANCLADYSAAATLNAAFTADLRRGGPAGEGWAWCSDVQAQQAQGCCKAAPAVPCSPALCHGPRPCP